MKTTIFTIMTALNLFMFGFALHGLVNEEVYSEGYHESDAGFCEETSGEGEGEGEGGSQAEAQPTYGPVNCEQVMNNARRGDSTVVIRTYMIPRYGRECME